MKDAKGEVITGRSSSGAGFSRYTKDPVFSIFAKRSAYWVGLPLSHAEDIQVIIFVKKTNFFQNFFRINF